MCWLGPVRTRWWRRGQPGGPSPSGQLSRGQPGRERCRLLYPLGPGLAEKLFIFVPWSSYFLFSGFWPRMHTPQTCHFFRSLLLVSASLFSAHTSTFWTAFHPENPREEKIWEINWLRSPTDPYLHITHSHTDASRWFVYGQTKCS